MAEKQEKKPEAAEKKEEGAKKKGGFLTKMPVLLGGVMVVEAVALIVGLKMLGFGKPKETVAAELVAEHADEDTHASADSGHGGDSKADAKSGEGGDAKAAPARKYAPKEAVELPVVELRAPNKQSGRTFLYDISIFVVVRGSNVDKVTKTLKDREAGVRDRIRTIIAQSDPEKLGGGSEPGLETLRRQVKYQLDEIVGEGMIEEVLIPRCIPFRTDY